MDILKLLAEVQNYGDARALGQVHGAEVHWKRVKRALYAVQDAVRAAEVQEDAHVVDGRQG